MENIKMVTIDNITTIYLGVWVNQRVCFP